MADYQVVAQATSLAGLESAIGDLYLPKGTRLRVAMSLTIPIGWAFNAAGAELIFKPFVPDGMDLVDVWGEGSNAYIEMEADPVWLLAALAFIKAHWLGIVIAGFVITTLIISLTVAVKVSSAIVEIPNWLVAGLLIGGVALLGVAIYKGVSSGKVQYQLKRGETYIRTAS